MGGESRHFCPHRHWLQSHPTDGHCWESRRQLCLCKGLGPSRQMEYSRKDTLCPATVVSASPTLGMTPRRGRLAGKVQKDQFPSGSHSVLVPHKPHQLLFPSPPSSHVILVGKGERSSMAPSLHPSSLLPSPCL